MTTTRNTPLANDAIVQVPLTIGQIRLLEAAMFDRGIMSSADVFEGRKSQNAHALLYEALQDLGKVFDTAVHKASR